MLAKEFIYEFTQPFEYANSGQMVEARNVVIQAPNNKVLMDITIIEEEYTKAQFKMMGAYKDIVGESAFAAMVEGRNTMSDEDKKTSKEVTGEEKSVGIISQMLAGGANMAKCYTALENILRTGAKGHEIALIDGQVQVTRPIFESMHPVDTKNILGKYIENFILSSQST